MGYYFGSGLGSKIVLGSTHVVEQLLLPSSAQAQAQLRAELVILSALTR